MGGKAADWAAWMVNQTWEQWAYTAALAAINFQFQHSEEYNIVLKYSEAGSFATPHKPNTFINVGHQRLPTTQLYPIRQRIATIPVAWLMRLGCLGCNLSHGQY